MDRLTEAAGLLRIAGVANQADRAEQPQLRRVAPVENLRQRYQEQEGTAPHAPPSSPEPPPPVDPPPAIPPPAIPPPPPPPPAGQPPPPAPPERPRRAPFNYWWNNVISDRMAQLQNVIYAGVEPLPPNPPPPPLRRATWVESLRARFQRDAQRQPQPPQNLGQGGPAVEPRGQDNNQPQQPRGILRNNRPARGVRVRFADEVGLPPGRVLRRRPRINDLRGRYLADADDDLA